MVDEGPRAAELLRLLKFFYSFSELPSMLDAPSQVLRYASMRVVPERDTARGIVKVVEYSIMPRLVARLPGPDCCTALTNPGVVELAALDCAEWIRGIGRVDLVVSCRDEWGAVLGYAAARLLRVGLRVASREAYAGQVPCVLGRIGAASSTAS